jgi:WD40 repeat protein
VQTFYGHRNAVNSVGFSLRGDTVVSGDADGVVKLWDVRMVAERRAIPAAEAAVNDVALDRSASLVAVACDDATVRVFNADDGSAVKSFKGHRDAVQAVGWDCHGKQIVSASSDNTARIWGREQ